MKIQIMLFSYLVFLFGCRSEILFKSNQVIEDETLQIINAYLEKECLPVNEKSWCHKSTDVIKVMDTLRWQEYFSAKVHDFVNQNNVQVSEDPVVLCLINSKFPVFFQNRVQLVKSIAGEDSCGTYSFSPAFRTANDNEYIIQIFFESYEMDYRFVLLCELVNNSFRVKEDLDGEVSFF